MRGKPRVKAGVKYVPGSFFAGEVLLDLADARGKMTAWLAAANGRVHGTTRQVPAVVFAAREAQSLLPAPAERYQVPFWAQVKVHVDYHIQVARALYSVPWRHAGTRVMARADEHLVKVYLRDQLIKTHPRKQPRRPVHRCRGHAAGSRGVCHPVGGPHGRAGRQLRPGHRDLRAATAGRRRAVDDDAVGLPAGRAGETLRSRRRPRQPAPVPWTSTSSTSPRSSRCSRTPPRTPRRPGLAGAAGAGPGRFARDAAEYATATGVRLQVLDGGSDNPRAAAGPDRSRQLPAAGKRTTRRGGGTRLIIPPRIFFSFLFFPAGKGKKKGPLS